MNKLEAAIVEIKKEESFRFPSIFTEEAKRLLRAEIDRQRETQEMLLRIIDEEKPWIYWLNLGCVAERLGVTGLPPAPLNPWHRWGAF